MRRRVHGAGAASLGLVALLLSSLRANADSNAMSPNPVEAPAIESSRVALARLLRGGESAEARRGGKVALAAREYDTASARSLEAWLAWLPDFSAALRRQLEQETEGEVGLARWRVDIEGQVEFSLQKLAAASVADAARAKARAEFAQARRAARESTLSACFALYLAERKEVLVKEQVSDFEHLSSAMVGARPLGSPGDTVLLEARLAELRGTLAEVERDRRAAAAHLAATVDQPAEASGLDPRLGAPQLLELIGAALADSPSAVDEIQQADLNLEQQRSSWSKSQSWYIPSLRADAIALFPKGEVASADGSSFRLSAVTAEVLLGLRLRPGVPALQAAEHQAVARSRLENASSRWLRRQAAEQAESVRDSLLLLWTDQRRPSLARSGYEEATRRFARGEGSVSELGRASHALLDSELEREAILQQALIAQILLMRSAARRGAAATPARPREVLAAAEANRRTLRAVEDAAIVKRPLAEAAAAAQRARSESYPLSTSLEAGLSLPLYESGVTSLEARPELTFAGAGVLATPVRELTALGRWSLDLRSVAPARRAFEAEAELRAAQAELERKRFLWAALAARLELSHARRSLAVTERFAAFAGEHLAKEQHWFQQGAATEREVRAAEISYRAAALREGRAAARVRAAELLVGSYLAERHGTRIQVDETPEALEAWAREHWLRERGLVGFEATLKRRLAGLEVAQARARTEALARPPRSATLTTQVARGLHGGAFSLTLALSVALDPPRQTGQVVRAAARAGEAAGRVESVEHELDELKARADARLRTANAELEAEQSTSRRLSGLRDTVRTAQAAAPEVHESVKGRESVAFDSELFESEERRLQADERRRLAALELLALGVDAPASRPAPSAAARTFPLTVSALVERRGAVVAADAAAREVRERGQPLPIVSALHVVGPFSVGSYLASRVTGPSTTKILQADQGIGVGLSLDEAPSFVAGRKLGQATELERRAARQSAELEAIHELAVTWTLRELERLSKKEASEATRYLENSVSTRFTLGQVTPALLGRAEQQRIRAHLRWRADEASLRAQRALLAARGASVDDAALDDYQRRAVARGKADLVSEASRADPTRGFAELAARARHGAASSDVVASALGVLSPVSVLGEFRPARVETTSGVAGARVSSTEQQVAGVISLLVPFKPRAFGRLLVESARARSSDEESGAARLAAERQRREQIDEYRRSRQNQAAARERRRASERALADLDQRFRRGEGRTSIDEVEQARAALYEAERAEIVADGTTLEATLSLPVTRSP